MYAPLLQWPIGWEKPLSHLWERGWGEDAAAANKQCVKAKAVKRKIKGFRSLSELLFFACAKKSNQKKAHPGLRVPPAYAVGIRSASGNFSTGHPCPVEKLGHPALRPAGFTRWLHRYGFMGPQKHKSNNTNNIKNNSNSHLPKTRGFMRLSWLLGCLLAFAWASSAIAQSPPESTPAPEVTLTTPRSIGWFLGDELDVTANITLPRGYTLEPASLPHPGPLNYWLELRSITHDSKRKGGQEHWQFTSRYQTFYVPLEARQRRIPGYTLRFSNDGDLLEVPVPGWTFTMSPLRQIAQEGGALGMQPDPPIRPVALKPAGTLAALAIALLFATALARHYVRWPFHQRPARPFSRAHHALRRHSRLGGDTTPALIVLHRAFDAAAGQRLLAGDVAAFIAQRPHLAACKAGIERFFAASRGAFFGAADAPMALPELVELAHTLARHERMHEARA